MTIGIVRALCLVFVFAIALITSFYCDLFTGAIVLALELVFLLETFFQNNSQEIIKLEDASYDNEIINYVKQAFAKACGKEITADNVSIERCWNSTYQVQMLDENRKDCTTDVDIYLCTVGSEFSGQVKMFYNVATESLVMLNVYMTGTLTTYSYWPNELISDNESVVKLWERL